MTLTTQFATMLSMLGMGALFGVMLDTYQRLLQRSTAKHWLIFFNDLLFWVIQALLIFYILFLVNKGEIRFYIFVALLCGFAAYQALLKGIYLRILERIIQTFISVMNFMKNLLLLLVFKPIRGLLQLIIFLIIFLGRGLFTLVKLILKIILWIWKFILNFFRKLLLFFWKLLPKGIKKVVEKLYNKTTGNFMKIKNTFGRFLNIWKKVK